MNEELIETIIDYIIDEASDKSEIAQERITGILYEYNLDDNDFALTKLLKRLKDENVKIIEEDNQIIESNLNDIVTDYLRDISCYKLLTETEEIFLNKIIIEGREAKEALKTNPNDEKLLEIVKRGDAAREKFINSNLRLVVNIAKDYKSSDVEFWDIISEGNIGLMNAVDKYDYRYGYRFSTYAHYLIRSSISKNIREISNQIKIPVNVLNDIAKIKKLQSEIEQKKGHSISEEELSEELNGEFNPKEISRLLTINGKASVSLDKQIGDESNSRALHEEITDNSSESIIDPKLNDILLNKLDKREREIISLFSGYGVEKKTLAQIGEIYCISASRVRQIKDRAKRKIEFYMKKD